MTTTANLTIIRLTNLETEPYVIAYNTGEFRYGTAQSFWNCELESQYFICPDRRYLYADDYLFDDADINEDGSFDYDPAYLISRKLVMFQSLEDAEDFKESTLRMMK